MGPTPHPTFSSFFAAAHLDMKASIRVFLLLLLTILALGTPPHAPPVLASSYSKSLAKKNVSPKKNVLVPIKKRLPHWADTLSGMDTFRETLLHKRAPNLLHLGAFNIEVFGPRKLHNKTILAEILYVIGRYDVILVQEVFNTLTISGLKQHLREWSKCSQSGEDLFGIVHSPPLGKALEYYVYIYRKDRVKVIDSFVYDGDRAMDFARPPFSLLFEAIDPPRKNGKEKPACRYGIIGLHAKPKNAPAELALLGKVYHFVQKRWDNPKTLIMGDLNADWPYLKQSDEGIQLEDIVASGREIAGGREIVGGRDIVGDSEIVGGRDIAGGDNIDGEIVGGRDSVVNVDEAIDSCIQSSSSNNGCDHIQSSSSNNGCDHIQSQSSSSSDIIPSIFDNSVFHWLIPTGTDTTVNPRRPATLDRIIIHKDHMDIVLRHSARPFYYPLESPPYIHNSIAMRKKNRFSSFLSRFSKSDDITDRSHGQRQIQHHHHHHHHHHYPIVQQPAQRYLLWHEIKQSRLSQDFVSRISDHFPVEVVIHLDPATHPTTTSTPYMSRMSKKYPLIKFIGRVFRK